MNKKVHGPSSPHQANKCFCLNMIQERNGNRILMINIDFRMYFMYIYICVLYPLEIERQNITSQPSFSHKKNLFFSFSARSFPTPAPKLQAKKNDPLYIAEKEKKEKKIVAKRERRGYHARNWCLQPLIVKSIRTTQSGEMSS